LHLIPLSRIVGHQGMQSTSSEIVGKLKNELICHNHHSLLFVKGITSMATYAGKTILITGASSGIGAAFAQTLAAQGANLLLVARSEKKLQELATKLQDQYTIKADVIVADLIQLDAGAKLFAQVEQLGLSVDVLINNAGFGLYGLFDTLDSERERQEILLDVASVVDLTHRFLPHMLAQKSGTIINVASTAAFQPVPYMAVYGASKAFVLSFSEALWGEYRKRGIKVLALCPGRTNTEFFDVAGTTDAALGSMETPEKVVRTALRAVEKGRPSVISGRMNVVRAASARFVPRAIVASVGAQIMRPGHSDIQQKGRSSTQ
jgi:uncharacterized protein